MGLHLYRQEPVFRRAIDACSQVIEDRLGWSLSEGLSDERGGLFHSEADRIQPAVTALQIALNEALFERGVRPDAVAGLSMGEAAACHAAGVLCLEQAMIIACCQAGLTRQHLRPGRMVMVNLSVGDLTNLIERSRTDASASGYIFSVASELSPTLTVISGQECEIRDVVSSLETQGVRCSMVPIHFAFHSPEVIPLQKPFLELFTPVKLQKSRIPIYSSVSGELQEGSDFTRDYWWRIFRDRARLLSASRLMLEHGYSVFLEIGPHPILLSLIAETAASMNREIRTISCMQRNADELATLEASLDAMKGVGAQIASRLS